MYRPLADEIRPKSFEDVVGQQHIMDLLRRIVDSGTIPNMVFYGPAGTGKTTVANIIAAKSGRTLHKLNATTASLSDIKQIIAELDTFLSPNGVLLYLDEIQYFNKKQQQSLLEFIENGKITLIASTTENPYFYVYNAILSRSTVFEFKAVEPAEVEKAVRRAIGYLAERAGVEPEIEPGVVEHIASACGGDVRKAINAVELLFASSTGPKGVTLRLKDAEALSQRSAMRYDREGDSHYDILSALQKSIRGSDPDAAVHYLGRLIEAGDMLSACRRLLVTACEDVGLAQPQAITIVKACVDSALQVGLPEARIPLGMAAVFLATAPKSNSAYMAIETALSDIKKGRTGDIPRHLQNVHADTTGMERPQGYLYPHDFPNHWVRQQYLPDAIRDRVYYRFGENKTEQAAKRYWDLIKNPQDTEG